MSIQYKVAKDSNGKVGDPAYTSDNKYSASLEANVHTTVTVPYGIPAGSIPAFQKNTVYTQMTVMPPGAAVWVCVNGTASIPAGNSLQPTNSEVIGVIPMGRIYQAGDVLDFVSATGGVDLSVKFYSANGD